MARQRKMDVEKIIQDGENPLGMTAQTANGTAHWHGTGWNKNPPYTSSQVEEGGAWQKPRSNRTGE